MYYGYFSVRDITDTVKRFIEYLFKKKDWWLLYYDLFNPDKPEFVNYHKIYNRTELQVNKHIMKMNQHRGYFLHIYGSYCVYMSDEDVFFYDNTIRKEYEEIEKQTKEDLGIK